MTRPAPPSLYDDDFYAWTQHQAQALRRIAVAARGEVDVDLVAEEIEDLGKRDLREVESYFERLFEHLIKIKVCPGSRDAPHWRMESRLFRRSALKAYAPSMRQLLDVAAMWRAAAKAATEDFHDIGGCAQIPSVCPFTLDALLAEEFDIDAALAEMILDP